MNSIYKKLYGHFGPQHWWPADSPFEVIVGAILTQNTNWRNVEKAINSLKKHKFLTPQKLFSLPDKELAFLIKSAGYYNSKSKCLKSFLKFFLTDYRASFRKISGEDVYVLRNKLLSVYGIGPETADSILLYALHKPVFVVDAYTMRILQRHKLSSKNADYAQVQEFFMKNLKNSVELFNEYHALLVKLGKDFCLKNKPRCQICPLK